MSSSITKRPASPWGTTASEEFSASNEGPGGMTTEAVAADPMLAGSKARDDLLPGCRFFRVEHHYLVYRCGPHGIEVGRILHERMNFEVRVADEAFGG